MIPACCGVLAFDLARASDDVDGVREALAHLPADSLSLRRIAELRVWLAAHRDDSKVEQAALADLLAIDPENTAAIGRLANLVIQSGQADRGRELFGRKAKLDGIKEQYNTLFTANHLDKDALELARLAGLLGRDFEAHSFLTIAAQKNPNNPEVAAALARNSRVRSGRSPGTGSRWHNFSPAISTRSDRTGCHDRAALSACCRFSRITPRPLVLPRSLSITAQLRSTSFRRQWAGDSV